MLSRTTQPATRMLLQRRGTLLSSQLQVRSQIRRQALTQPTRRFQSTHGSQSASASSGGGSSQMLLGGLAGGAGAFFLGYLWYHFSGAKALVQAGNTTQQYIESAKKKVASSAKDIEPNQALDWLRQTTLQYAGLIPGAKKYVETVFKDIDRVRENHGDEVDKAVQEAVQELKSVVGKKGASLDAFWKAGDVLQKFVDRVSDLAGDAAQDILEAHPQLKEKLGGSLGQLKEMGEAYGPEAKKSVDEAWNQIRDILKSGDVSDAAEKIQKLVKEQTEKLRKLADQAWKKGMEQAKPYLDRNPQVKKLIEENQEELKKGNFTQLWDLAKQATDSGSTEKLEKFIKEKVGHAKESGMSGLDDLFNMIPGGDQIGPKISMLQKLAEKRGKEAEKILKETVEEIQDVLKKRTEEAKKLVDKAEKDAR